MPNYLEPKLPLQLKDENEDFVFIEDSREQVKQKLKMIILTNPGEKIMMPEFGCGIRQYLFENPNGIINEYTVDGIVDAVQVESITEKIKSTIQQQVEKFLSEIKITSLNVFYENDKIYIEIFYTFNNFIESNFELTISGLAL